MAERFFCSCIMKRIQKTVLWTLVPSLVFVVSSAVSAAEPEGFEQTKLESGVTVADIEPLKDGRLLMVLDHDGELRSSFSHDDGKTWKTSFQLLPKPDGDAGYHHPSLTRARNGDLLLSYQYYVRKTRPVYKISYYRRSKDEGKTWGDQLFMASDGLFNDKPIVLSTGRLIAPVEREARVAGGDHAGYVSSVFFSDDNGYSWTRSNEVNALPIEAQEPHVVELKDGRLMMLCRTYSRFVLRSYSKDKGKTWSTGEPIRELELPAWSSALNVKRIPSTGDLLLLRSLRGEDGVRSPFVSVISKDDGKTWINERIIASDPKERYGYPCLLFIGETAIIGYGSFAGSRVARIPVKWFYETPRANRAAVEKPPSPGIAKITKGPPALTMPTNAPAGEMRWYGLGFAFQVAPGKAGLFCNRHIDDAGDHEDGADLFLFDSLEAITPKDAISVSRNEIRVNPKSGQRELATKYPMQGGFVPLGARRADGSPHPHAGTGFGICTIITHSGATRRRYLQLHQFSFDGRNFRTRPTTPVWDGGELKVGDSTWMIGKLAMSFAIPDGDDLLYPAVASNGKGESCGISRWQRRDGTWKPVAFQPVVPSGMEPSLSRDVDGSLLFCVRGAGSSGEFATKNPNAIRVWRSTDDARTWKVIVDEPDQVGFNPISINRALDGTPYVVSNVMKEDRSYSREVLALWPLNKQRRGLVARRIVRDGPREFGQPPTGRTWKLDHPTSATLQLRDGKWHHVLIYRGKEDPTSRKPIPRAGCYVEEVTSSGPPLPLWNLQIESPSPGR